MTTLTINLPLPPKGCSVNTHTHWRVRHRATKQYRADAELAAKAAFRESKVAIPLPPCTMHITYYNGARGQDACYRPKDEDNAIAAIKAAKDGFTDAGLWEDDTSRHVRMGEIKLLQTMKEHGGRAGVVVRVEWE